MLTKFLNVSSSVRIYFCPFNLYIFDYKCYGTIPSQPPQQITAFERNEFLSVSVCRWHFERTHFLSTDLTREAANTYTQLPVLPRTCPNTAGRARTCVYVSGSLALLTSSASTFLSLSLHLPTTMSVSLLNRRRWSDRASRYCEAARTMAFLFEREACGIPGDSRTPETIVPSYYVLRGTHNASSNVLYRLHNFITNIHLGGVIMTSEYFVLCNFNKKECPRRVHYGFYKWENCNFFSYNA